ncbi:MAG TPA: ABC transporter ATP-binding protein [Acidimicrobiales bacterium]|nr:ABC transporter ATP-binding protein [Acidimicrobiales bacterium]
MTRATIEPPADDVLVAGVEPAEASTAPPLLSVRDLVVDFGLTRAVSGVSFDVPAGSVLAVLGSNGAGKSTVASAVSGLVAPTSGHIELDGRDVTSWPAHRVARQGVTHVLEGRGVFPGLTVAENLRLSVSRTVAKSERADAVARALDMFPVLAERRRQATSTLSGGERQMLALARVLAVPPRLLVADELSLGLAPKLVEMSFDVLRQARDAGVTVVLVEQFVERALELADDALILRRGRMVWSGKAQDAGATVLDEYLGVEEEGS